MVVTGQKILREKKTVIQGQGRVRKFYFESARKIDILKKSQ